MSNYDAGIYDFYDDKGALLRRLIDDESDIPDFVKEASIVDPQTNNRLFALVMVDDGKVMRKFATADRGNTWLSALYFALTKDSLPEQAQKVAAANLIEACEAFDIAAPDMLWDYADGPEATNIVDVTGLSPKTKVATGDREEVQYAIERADGSKHYPLRDAAEVKTAMDYFDRHATQFVPRERREFAVKVAAEAAKGQLPLTEKVAAYAGTGWNPAYEAHLTQRYVFLRDAGTPLPARAQLMKLAEVRKAFNPEEMAEALEVFDREFGLDAMWDKDLSDPWFAITGDYPDNFEKLAKGSVPTPATYSVGEATVTEAELEGLANRGMRTLGNHFGTDFAVQFQKNPLSMFESMPLPQRKFIARLASGHADDTADG